MASCVWRRPLAYTATQQIDKQFYFRAVMKYALTFFRRNFVYEKAQVHSTLNWRSLTNHWSSSEEKKKECWDSTQWLLFFCLDPFCMDTLFWLVWLWGSKNLFCVADVNKGQEKSWTFSKLFKGQINLMLDFLLGISFPADVQTFIGCSIVKHRKER